MAMTTFAAIDIGAYEVSMKIFELSKKQGLKELNYVRHGLETGKNAYSRHSLDRKELDDLCDTLIGFKRVMAEYGVTEHRACATSSFRELSHQLIIIEQIYQRTGIKIEVLSSAEQHFLGYKSIASMESGFKKMIQKGTAIVEVGGGGIQISLFDKDKLVTTQNMKMGSIRIRENLKELEKTTIHYAHLVEEFIRNDLTNFARLHLKDRDIKHLILMGDFLTDTIFKEELSDRIITRKQFTAKYEQVIDRSVPDLAEMMGLDEEYASLVVPTMVICERFFDIFNAEAMWAPGVALVDGIAYDYAEKIKVIKSAHIFEEDILVACRNIAKRFSTDKEHIQGTTKLALTIFDSMKKIHGMSNRERLLLQVVVQLHDCGKYISLNNVPENSYMIVMATEVVGLSTEERTIIANTIRYNAGAFPSYDELSEHAGISISQFLVISKLTAILRIANALDRSHYQKILSMKAVLKDRVLQLMLDSDLDLSLEVGLLKNKVAFFEEIFGISLELKRKRRV